MKPCIILARTVLALLYFCCLSSNASAQYPIYLGTGPYQVPYAAYGNSQGWYYASAPTPRYPVCIPGVGCFSVRNQRDMKILQANLAKRGITWPQTQPVRPMLQGCPGGRCPLQFP